MAGEYAVCHPAGWFDGRVTLAIEPGRIHLAGWRYTHHNWRVTAFELTQTPASTSAAWTIRTPAGQPDITIEVEDRCTADLVRHCPAVGLLLGIALPEIGSGPYRPGEYLEAIAAGERADGRIWVKVASAVELLGSRSPRRRLQGEDEIDALGWEGALALRTWPLSGLTDQQRMSVQSILAGWPESKSE